MYDELDPEIAALLANESSMPSKTSIEDVMEDDDSFTKSKDGVSEVDLSIREFKPITEFFSSTPSDVFDDSNYYKNQM